MHTVYSSHTLDLKRKMDSMSPVLKSFLAGSFSGICSTILLQPLDLVKTRIQTVVYTNGEVFSMVSHSALILNTTLFKVEDQCWMRHHSEVLGNVCHKVNLLYEKQGASAMGIFQVASNVVRNEKIQGLWKGVIPSLTRTVPGIGVFFCTLHTLRSNFGSADPHPVESIAIGMIARSVSGVSMLPVTVVKTRFESGRFAYRGVGNALVTIARVEGLRGLFSGLAPTLVRDAPFSGLYLMFYTQAKKYVRTMDLKDSTAPAVHFSCGILAGCLASIVTQPADVVKTHMQLGSNGMTSARQVIKYIYQIEGAKGFLRGIVPRTLRRTLMAALAWTVYEQVMKSCGIK